MEFFESIIWKLLLNSESFFFSFFLSTFLFYYLKYIKKLQHALCFKSNSIEIPKQKNECSHLLAITPIKMQ